MILTHSCWLAGPDCSTLLIAIVYLLAAPLNLRTLILPDMPDTFPSCSWLPLLHFIYSTPTHYILDSLHLPH